MPSWLDQTARIIAEDFADIPDVGAFARAFVRLGMAALLGGMIGWQREAAGKAAGLRTHMLVAIGAALFVLVCRQAGMNDDATSHVLQGLVAGVGFLGAGAILKDPGDGKVMGLTTAAGIWVTAAIGVCAGLGKESTAILATLLTLAILALLGRLEARWSLASDVASAPPPRKP